MAGTYEKKDYLESEAVKNAREQMNQHSSTKPAQYQSQWQPKMLETFDKIQNRQPFQYDINSDALYQQLKDQYSTLGNRAMMDTMGQQAALTGGYGNSYAQTAGQQAYQGYLQQLSNAMPDLYSMALSRYNAEGDALAQQYGMMADQENLDYARYRDLMADHENEYNRLYNAYRDEQALDYNTYRDMIADLQWQAQFDENNRRYNQEWEAQQAAAAAAAAKSKSGRSGGSGGGGGNGGNGGDGNNGLTDIDLTIHWDKKNDSNLGIIETDLQRIANDMEKKGYSASTIESVQEKLVSAALQDEKINGIQAKQRDILKNKGKLLY